MDIKPTDTHAVIYVGAPYGEGEGGHVEFSGTESQCERALWRMSPCKQLDCRIINLDQCGWTRYTGSSYSTAREYFA